MMHSGAARPAVFDLAERGLKGPNTSHTHTHPGETMTTRLRGRGGSSLHRIETAGETEPPSHPHRAPLRKNSDLMHP